jgi:hypothetical protein
LTVRLRATYFKTAPLPILSLKKKSDKDPEKDREGRHAGRNRCARLPDADTDVAGVDALADAGVGTQVRATIQITREALTFDLGDGKQSSDLDIGGIFYNDKGKPLNSLSGG